jgi:histidine triad (HIT) family protein
MVRAEAHQQDRKEINLQPRDIFCEIIDRKSPSIRIIETDYALVIMDLSGGYPLVVSRGHPDTPFQVLELAGKLIPFVKKAYHADAVRILLNDGEAAGQDIPHPHVHIMPRMQVDNGVGRTIIIKDQQEKEKMARKIRDLSRELVPHLNRKKQSFI